MSNRQEKRLLMRDLGANRFGRVLAGFLAATPVMTAAPAFAQTPGAGRVLGRDAYAGNAVSQEARLRTLGGSPVLDERHPQMTREIAEQSVAALGARVDAVNGRMLVETLSYAGSERARGTLAQQLASAGADRLTGDAQWTNITDSVEAAQEGTQLEAGARIEIRRVAIDSRRIIPGMTHREGDNVVFGGETSRLRGAANGESTTGLEIRITKADGSSQLIGYFDQCGNITPWEVAPAPVAAAIAPEALDPCVSVRVRAPRGVRFTNESVRARVVTLDLGRGNAFPAEECPAETQVTVNCTETCSDLMVNAANLSEPYRRVLQRVGRERGTNAAISRYFTPDATYIPNGDNEGSVQLQIRRSQLNDNVAVIICLDWEGGGSEIVTLTDIDTNDEGVITADARGSEFSLNMSGANPNVRVLRDSQRPPIRVVRGTGRSQ